jgi:ribosomal protein S18 acetylase RimI-like enzyme
MIALRKLVHEDYDDILEISKDIWDGTDYLPSIFHSWVEDKQGVFVGAVDTDLDKVIGVDKYTVLPDGTGWLEGMRVHIAYRGRKIAKLLTDHILNCAKADLQEGKIKKIAFSTHVTNVESIGMMEKYGFEVEQQHILVHKEREMLDPQLNIKSFTVKPWDIGFEEFANLPFIKRRNGIFHISFSFQEPTIEYFNYLKEHNCFVNINGYNGIYLVKGEPHFVTQEESFEAIEAFTNYYLLASKDNPIGYPLFSTMENDIELIERLKAAKYDTWTNWQADYLYYVMK